MAYDNFLIDKRVVERNITKGLVDPEQLKQHIEALPDRESNCVHVSLEGGAQASDDTRVDSSDDADDDDDDLGDDDDDDDEDDEGDDAPDAAGAAPPALHGDGDGTQHD